MSDEGTTIKEAMKAIAVGDEIGIGAAVTVATRDSMTRSLDSSFKKGVDMIVGTVSQGGSARGRCSGQSRNCQHSFSTSSNA